MRGSNRESGGQLAFVALRFGDSEIERPPVGATTTPPTVKSFVSVNSTVSPATAVLELTVCANLS